MTWWIVVALCFASAWFFIGAVVGLIVGRIIESD